MDINTKFGLMFMAKSYYEEYREEKKKLEADKKYDLDLKILGYSTASNINTINIHKELKLMVARRKKTLAI